MLKKKISLKEKIVNKKDRNNDPDFSDYVS